jgi:hypothetical protein
MTTCAHCGKTGASSSHEALCGIRFVSGQLSWTWGTSGVASVSVAEKDAQLPVVRQDDLLQGTKYAGLWRGKDGQPEFRGVGDRTHSYGTESYARCGQRKSHRVPDRDCGCGFWIATRPESRLAVWEPSYVALEVEFGGRVLDCGKEPLPAEPWGYRAQWQRVLSVSLSPGCGANQIQRLGMYGTAPVCFYIRGLSTAVACAGPVRWLVSIGGEVSTACENHAAAGSLVRKPVTWLREGLQTEIRPGDVSDDAPAPQYTEPELPVKKTIGQSYTRGSWSTGGSLQVTHVWQYVLLAGNVSLPYTTATGVTEASWDIDAVPGGQYSYALPSPSGGYRAMHDYTIWPNTDGTVTVTEQWTE